MARKTRALKQSKPRKGAAGSEQVMARYKVEAVSRAMLLLEAFRHGPASLSVDELATRTGLPQSALAATLATLEGRGLVQAAADEPGRYRLGLAWLRLADVKRRQLDIREVALPVLRRMRDTVNETASLSIRIGTSRVNIEYAEGQHEVRRIVQPGYHLPLHVGAGGRALMSGLDERAIEAYLAPIALSQIEKSQLIASIETTRRDGYAIIDGEVASDTAAISAPARNHVGEVVAAVSLSLPVERLSQQMRARCIKEVLKAAGEVSLALGFDPARA